jgi:hypothetical protein
MHTARNLITIRTLMLKEIHWRRHRNLITINAIYVLYGIEPYDRCFLTMEHSGAEYIGVLLVSDTAFTERFSGYYFKPW